MFYRPRGATNWGARPRLHRWLGWRPTRCHAPPTRRSYYALQMIRIASALSCGMCKPLQSFWLIDRYICRTFRLWTFRDTVPVAVCECVSPYVAMIIINVNFLFLLWYSCMTLLFDWDLGNGMNLFIYYTSNLWHSLRGMQDRFSIIEYRYLYFTARKENVPETKPKLRPLRSKQGRRE
jgi:hypothetical protein